MNKTDKPFITFEDDGRVVLSEEAETYMLLCFNLARLPTGETVDVSQELATELARTVYNEGLESYRRRLEGSKRELKEMNK